MKFRFPSISCPAWHLDFHARHEMHLVSVQLPRYHPISCPTWNLDFDAGHEIQPRFNELASISSLARVETFRLQGMCRVFSCPGGEIFLNGPLPGFFNAQSLEIWKFWKMWRLQLISAWIWHEEINFMSKPLFFHFFIEISLSKSFKTQLTYIITHGVKCH